MEKEKKDNAGVILHPPVIFVIVLVAGLLLNKYFPLNILYQSEGLLKIIGSVIFVFYGIVNIPTVIMMLRRKTGLSTHQQTTTLVTEVFFKDSRNPLYFSLVVLYCGIAIYQNSLWSLFFSPLLIVMLKYFVIVREESYLESKFGDDYLQYKENVRRWI